MSSSGSSLSTPRSRVGLASLPLVLGLGLLLAACVPTAISLSELADHQDQYAGQTVTTAGTVRHFTDGGGYDVLEDPAGNRVMVRPASSVSAFLGHAVSVTGRFTVDSSAGRVINADSVRPSSS